MGRDFNQVEWDDALVDDARRLIRLAVREDLDRQQDWTTIGLAPPDARGAATYRTRRPGVAAGLQILPLVVSEMELDLRCDAAASDGQTLAAGDALARVEGSARDLLTSERLMLNLLGRLCGVATLTRQYVDAAAGGAAIYDTRKTTPGWRRLEKHAVRCGGGRNHRLGLYDAVLIKDNHLALARQQSPELPLSATIARCRELLEAQGAADKLVEVEVDTLDQLREILPARPDIVLLDNMSVETLRSAVALRDQLAPQVALEASGGVNLETVGRLAQCGVERISVGALTHSAVSLDIGLDWAGLD